MSFPRRAAQAASFALAIVAAFFDTAGAQDAAVSFRSDARRAGVATPVLPSVAVPARSTPLAPRDSVRDVQPPGALVGGIAGAVIGLQAGRYLGASLAYSVSPRGSEYAGLTGWVLGAWMGMTVGAAVGANLMDGRRGSMGKAFGGAFAGSLLAIGLYSASEEEVLGLAIPVCTVLGAVIGEVKTRKR